MEAGDLVAVHRVDIRVQYISLSISAVQQTSNQDERVFEQDEGFKGALLARNPALIMELEHAWLYASDGSIN